MLGRPIPGLEVGSSTPAPAWHSATVRSASCRSAARRSRSATTEHPEATDELLGGGWLHTGDLAYTGRRRDGDVRPHQGRHHHRRPQHLPPGHRAGRRAASTTSGPATSSRSVRTVAHASSTSWWWPRPVRTTGRAVREDQPAGHRRYRACRPETSCWCRRHDPEDVVGQAAALGLPRHVPPRRTPAGVTAITLVAALRAPGARCRGRTCTGRRS